MMPKYLAVFVFTFSAAVSLAFDIGGPCYKFDEIPAEFKKSEISFTAIHTAEKNKDYPKLILYQKQRIRSGGCSNDYLWSELVEIYLKAKQETEAIGALEEMEKRGFEIPSEKDRTNRFLRLESFVNGPTFANSKVGKLVNAKIKVAEDQKKAFLEKIKAMKNRPPEVYEAKGSCPFECCTFGPWFARNAIEVMDQPRSIKKIAALKKDDIFTGLTGISYTKPSPVGVVADFEEFKKGDVIFLLQGGEESINVWKNGVTVFSEVHTHKSCQNPGPNCAAIQLGQGNPYENDDWWVQIRLNNGKIGWTNQTDEIGNKDACASEPLPKSPGTSQNVAPGQ